MNRRGFLSGLLGTAAALTLDPERLLWKPGGKLISIPNRIKSVPPLTLAMLNQAYMECSYGREEPEVIYCSPQGYAQLMQRVEVQCRYIGQQIT